ncbi:hypothetical protein SAMN05216252_102484 [Actinacidiphila glaucinigra]|uniref:Uncharacterized protein n=1 Tax=Actinacidiphila glaucinigra TaxID=235986 RepID=A0A239B9L1_9ACTN|nr:hypothetical protein SAMN05216252_102484 [Actinacidiphila glaucinigra]
MPSQMHPSLASRALRVLLGAGVSYALATGLVLLIFALLPQDALRSLQESGFFWTVLATAVVIFAAGALALRGRRER